MKDYSKVNMKRWESICQLWVHQDSLNKRSPPKIIHYDRLCMIKIDWNRKSINIATTCAFFVAFMMDINMKVTTIINEIRE